MLKNNPLIGHNDKECELTLSGRTHRRPSRQFVPHLHLAECRDARRVPLFPLGFIIRTVCQHICRAFAIEPKLWYSYLR